MMDKIEIELMPILDFSHLPSDWHGFDLVCPTVRMSKEEFEKMFLNELEAEKAVETVNA